MSFRPANRTMKLLACGLFLGLLATLLFVHPSSAEDATPAAPAAAAAAAPAAAKPAPPAPPACAAPSAAVAETDKYAAVPASPGVLTNCTPNSGDTAWMLTSVALVLMMTIPGLGLFYGGMVRKKNVVDTVMTSFAITALVTFLYAAVTYTLSFTPGSPFIGGLSRAFLQGILSDVNNGGIGNPNPLAPTIPETVYMCFQMTFAIITPALIAGAFAERMKFSAMLVFMTLWAIFVYAPVAHWVWGPDGFLNSANSDAKFHVLDFAGGTVVHVNSGVAGLMCALMLGKRKDTGPAHNIVLTFIGASLLWVGWFGFNAGSAVTAGSPGRHGDDRHADRHRRRGAGLDVLRMGPSRQADPPWHLLGRSRRPRRHYAGLRFRRSCRGDGDRSGRGGGVLHRGHLGQSGDRL